MVTAFNPLLRCYGNFGRPTIDGTWRNFVTQHGAVADGVLVPVMLDTGNGPFIRGYTMTGTDNSAALLDWVNYGISQGASAAKLFLPPGFYHIAGNSSFTCLDGAGAADPALYNGIQNAYISGYGAAVDSAFFGPNAVIPQDHIHSARFATTSVGATSITLIDSGVHLATEISRFSVGQWILMFGDSLQGNSYPANGQFYEFRQITAINSNTISFTDPLIYAYKSTWPERDIKSVAVSNGTPAEVTLTNHGFSANQTVSFDLGSGGTIPTGITRYQTYFVISAGLTSDKFRFSTSIGGAAVDTTSTGSSVYLHTQNNDHGGPATVIALRESFKNRYEVYGLRVTSAVQVAIVGGQSAFLCGMQFDGDGPAPTVGRSIIIRRTQVGRQNEVDKCIDYMEYNECSSTHPSGTRQLDFQSPGVYLGVVKNSRLTISGTAKNMIIDNCQIPLLNCGPTSYGHGSTLSISNSTVTVANPTGRQCPLSSLSFSSGTFSVPLVLADNAFATFVPGTKCAFGIQFGGVLITPDASQPVQTLTVLDIRQDATTMYIDTNWAGAVPPAGITYQGGPATLIGNYSFDTGGLTTSNYTGPSLAGFVAP